jgi:hypothetical protein
LAYALTKALSKHWFGNGFDNEVENINGLKLPLQQAAGNALTWWFNF